MVCYEIEINNFNSTISYYKLCKIRQANKFLNVITDFMVSGSDKPIALPYKKERRLAKYHTIRIESTM